MSTYYIPLLNIALGVVVEDCALIEFVCQATVAPMTREWVNQVTKRPCFNGGVYYENGEICKGGIQKKQADNMPDAVEVSDLAVKPGSYVFGGLLQGVMFGHFLVESLSRLWAVEFLSEHYATIVFYSRNPLLKVSDYVGEVLGILFPRMRIEVVTAPTKYELLAVPAQIIQSNGHIYGHPVVRKMCARFPKGAIPGVRKLFISRSKQDEYSSNIIGENLIDRYLQEEGYTIVYPEEHTVSEQVELYSSAEKLIFSDGSALHLYALIARPEQKVFIIYRRLGEHFGWQIESFGGPRLQGTPCVEKLWLPSHVLQHHSLAQGGKALLNFPALSAQLKTAGFIESSDWPELPVIDAEMAIANLEKRGRHRYSLLPLPSDKKPV